MRGWMDGGMVGRLIVLVLGIGWLDGWSVRDG